MFSSLATVILIVSFVLGGGGVTAVAAQNSQPDQVLYGVKLVSEDIRLGLTSNARAEAQLALQFADRRAVEIQTMLQAGSIPPEAVQIRYQNQVEQAIQYALNLPKDQAIQALEQIRTRLQTQQQAFLQVQENGSAQAVAALAQSRLMLQERLLWVEQGLADPDQFRDQLRQHDRQRTQDRLNSTATVEQSTQSLPGTGAGNPWITGIPTPGSEYGPGDCENCTPMGDGQGSNPWTSGTPTPGSGYGPDPGLSATCTSSPSNGPQPTQPQNNQPTQAESQPIQVGPQPTQQNNQPTQAGSGQHPTPMPGEQGGTH